MKSIMVSLVLVGICFAGSMYSMEEYNVTRAEINIIKAQKSYNKGQEAIGRMEANLMFSCCPDEESYVMHEATEKSKINDIFCKSRRYIKRVLNDKNVDEVTKKSALEIEKKIDAISWASK